MATEVFSCFHDASKKVSSGSKLATLFVPDGPWFIVGKVVVHNDNPSTYQLLTARLIAGADLYSYVRLGPRGVHSAGIMALAFTVVHTFPGNSNQAQNAIDLVITLDPVGPNAFMSAELLKITAFRVDSRWPVGSGDPGPALFLDHGIQPRRCPDAAVQSPLSGGAVVRSSGMLCDGYVIALPVE